LGAVRLYEKCKENVELLKKTIDERIEEYGKVPVDVDYYAIGGTATTLASLDAGLEVYDEKVVDGRCISYKRVCDLFAILKNNSVAERIEKLHVDSKRAEIIVGGTYLLKCIMEKFGIKKVIVSEGDNMLGYLKKNVLGEKYGR
jgi:exopolyphosphatase/guanosine-5'-triphosphate,3'-diphosphate pyrophosphatase